jgi:anti-sigma factor ChrR (cupin superfamily)
MSATRAVALKLHADLTQAAFVRAAELAWVASPLPGVDRRMLDRDGDEVARATSIVRYAPDSHFSRHRHALGEEFLVLEGVFSDEHGDYPAGSYLRNPPGSAHTPFSQAGCTIFVKLRQMHPEDRTEVRLDPSRANWLMRDDGSGQLLLHEDAHEAVLMERLAPGAKLESQSLSGGEEVLVVEGEATSERFGELRALDWYRDPQAVTSPITTKRGALLWIKRGHLR